MTYASWQPRHRATSISPGKADLIVLTLVNSECASIEAIMDYDAAVARAEEMVRRHPCQVKVLPMSGVEVRNFFGVSVPAHPQPMDAGQRLQFVATLKGIARGSSDMDARTDAFDLLTDMGFVS